MVWIEEGGLNLLSQEGLASESQERDSPNQRNRGRFPGVTLSSKASKASGRWWWGWERGEVVLAEREAWDNPFGRGTQSFPHFPVLEEGAQSLAFVSHHPCKGGPVSHFTTHWLTRALTLILADGHGPQGLHRSGEILGKQGSWKRRLHALAILFLQGPCHYTGDKPAVFPS